MSQGFVNGIAIPLGVAQGGTGTVGTGILDTNGNELITLVTTASAVNHIQMLNNATGSAPAISAIGDDANISLQLNGKGTSGVPIVGVTDASNSAAREVGEFVQSIILQASAVTMTNVTAANVTSISLSAGDWDVWGNISAVGAGTSQTQVIGWVSSTSVTLPDAAHYSGASLSSGIVSASCGGSIPSRRFNVSGTTTIYLGAYTSLSGGTSTVCGSIYARRVR